MFQQGDTFEMVGLWEHVDRLAGNELIVSVFAEHLSIAGERRGDRVAQEFAHLKIHACDPVAIENAKQVLNDVTFFENPYETIRDCDALVVATEWNEFRNLDMRAVKILLKNPVIVDGRNIYDPKEMKDLGFTYMGIGR